MSEKSVRAIAKQFAVYNRLDGIDRWKLCRSLRWIRRDPVSLQSLLELEERLVAESLWSWQVFEMLMTALVWYNDKVQDRTDEPVPRGRFSEIIEIAEVFLEESPKLLPEVWDLSELVALVAEDLEPRGKGYPGVTPEQFRLGAAKAVFSFGQNDGRLAAWNPSQAGETKRTLMHLATIARKVTDLEQFATVYRDMAPTIGVGLQATASLMAMCQDFQEFSSYFTRVSAQLQWWQWSYADTFYHVQSVAELDHILGFLEALVRHPLVAKCICYAEAYHGGVRLLPSTEVKAVCCRHPWSRGAPRGMSFDRLVESSIQNIAHRELQTLWSTTWAGREIRWPFYAFTEYVPYAMRTDDWTVDNKRTRHYWDWQAGRAQEFKRFLAALLPRLCARFRELDIEEFKILLSLLPSTVTIEKFRQAVEVPVAWQRDVVMQEMYQRWVGFYDEELEVARPRSFVLHTFTFERPSFQKAINLLDDVVELRQAIQAHRHSGG